MYICYRVDLLYPEDLCPLQLFLRPLILLEASAAFAGAVCLASTSETVHRPLTVTWLVRLLSLSTATTSIPRLRRRRGPGDFARPVAHWEEEVAGKAWAVGGTQ